MTCSDITAFDGESRDAEGGKVELVEIGAGADSAIIVITTPWASDSMEVIDLNETKAFSRGDKTFSVKLTGVSYSSYRDEHFCRFKVCYDITPTPTPTPTPAPGLCEQTFKAIDGSGTSINGVKVTIGDTDYITDSTGITKAWLTTGTKYLATIRYNLLTNTHSFTACTGDIIISTFVVETPTPVGYIKCQAYDSISYAGLAATIQLNGITIVPKTPHTTIGMSLGDHTVTFILDGYATKTVTVTVKAGETVNAYGSMVKEALPAVPGFDISVDIPSLLDNSTLYVSEVVKVPFTNTWWDSPFGAAIRWDNISNGTFKARELKADCNPVPPYFAGFRKDSDYVIYVGTSSISLFPSKLVHHVGTDTTAINITESYVDWVSTTLCSAFGISLAECPNFILTSVSDAAFLLEQWKIITEHKNLADEETIPTLLDYILVPVAIFGIFSPGISEGKVAQVVGKRITELLKITKTAPQKVKDVALHSHFDTFMLRATESQFDDFVRFMKEGLVINAKSLLDEIEFIPLSVDELHALHRGARLVDEVDDALVNANSLSKTGAVLSRFSDKLRRIFTRSLDWARDNPKSAFTIGVLTIWFMIDNIPFYIYMYLKATGRSPGDKSWQGKLYSDTIDQYKFNVIGAEKISNWELFCENLLLWKTEVDSFEAYINENVATLQNEETYYIYLGVIAAYREAIKIKNEVHSCWSEPLPEIITAKVVDIIDGDSVLIEYNGTEYECRFVGINTPEGSGENYLIRRLICPSCGEERWNANKALYDEIKSWANTNMWHRDLTFKSDLNRQFDDYGRLLALPFDGAVNLCKKELELGYAVVFFYDVNKQVNTTEFLASEMIAKNANRGVWAVAIDTGTIKCISYPTAAEVWLDNIYTGMNTISNVRYLENISVGSHTITFKKIIDNVPSECYKTVNVTKDATITAECTLIGEVSPTPHPTPTPTPTPPPGEAIWYIGDVKDKHGLVLGAAKVYVDDVYIGHYAPETLTFCTGCKCDSVVPCGFGTHTVTIKRTDYVDWTKTRIMAAGDSFTDSPIMQLITATFPVTIESMPGGAVIIVDDIEVQGTDSLLRLSQILNGG